MNQYKAAWLSHAMSDYSRIDNQDQREKDSSPSFTDHVIDQSTDWAVEYGAFVALSYMATSHYPKIRIVGAMALRLLPVVAIAGIAYSIYKILDD